MQGRSLIKKTMIFGNSLCALDLAEELVGMGIQVTIVSRDPCCDFSSLDKRSDNTNRKKPERLSNTRLLACHGAVGNFKVFLDSDGERVSKTVSNIVIAEDYQRAPNFSLYNLKPSKALLSLSAMMEILDNRSRREDLLSDGKKVAFFTGLLHESDPLIHKEIMRSCLTLQSDVGAQTYLFTKNLKVADEGLEILYKKTREAGTIYIKALDSVPEVGEEKNRSRVITYYDEITRERCRLTADIIVVDETIHPSNHHRNLAEILNIDADDLGFLQADNVHRYNLFTNRVGIFAAGPSRAVLSPIDQRADAHSGAIQTMALMAGKHRKAKESALIDGGACIRCLTCYRLCPYHAVFVNSRPYIEPDACEGCGICVAECPRQAITLESSLCRVLSGQVKKEGGPRTQQDFAPRIAAFCCARSSMQAMETAASLGYPLPDQMDIFEVPCAGSLSVEDILGAFNNNYDGVLVLSCHKGNCHSEKGYSLIVKRTDHLTDRLTTIGLEKERLQRYTLASNMGRECAEICTRFRDRLVALGPIRLR